MTSASGPERERDVAPRPQDGATSPISVEVLAAQVREQIERYVPDGFRDEAGVWHDGPHRAESLAALAALVARVTEAERPRRARPNYRPEEYDEVVAALADARNALERIAQQQPDTLATLRRHGIVFDGPLGADPKNWQHVAFSVYTDLCEVDSVAREVLARLDGSSE